MVVIVNGPDAMDMLRSTVAACTGTAESLSLNVSGVAVMGFVGVPLIWPVAAFKVRPAGNVPAVNCQLVLGTPPVDVSVCEYAVPTLPLGSDVVVIVSGPDAMDMLRVAMLDCEPESLTWNTNCRLVTTSIGVPLIDPVLEFSVRPAGKLPETTSQL